MSTTDEIDAMCELAPLYSLGALDDADAWRFREHLLEGCDACRGELAGFDEVASLLVYAAEPAAPSPILRSRLMDAVAEDIPEVTIAELAGDGWVPYKVPGVHVRRLHVDEAARRVVMLVRAEKGVTYPSHRHADVEEMFMLSGELRFGERVYRAGDYIRSESGSVHGSSETLTGCMFLIRASLDNELMY
jgi:putative transcriptional regulator